jgi:hypothetical protein
MAVTFPQTDLPRSVGGGRDGWDGGAGALLLDDYFVTTSDVTVALTGAASTAQAGALSVLREVALVGADCTAAPGTIEATTPVVTGVRAAYYDARHRSAGFDLSGRRQRFWSSR